MCQAIRNPADRRFARNCQKVTGICLIGYLICVHFVLDKPVSLSRLVLAGVTGTFLFALLISSGLLLLRKRDEFQRILLTRSFLWATIITMGFTTIWGFVQLFSRGTLPAFQIIWLPVILICLTAAAKLLIFRHHRSPRE